MKNDTLARRSNPDHIQTLFCFFADGFCSRKCIFFLVELNYEAHLDDSIAPILQIIPFFAKAKNNVTNFRRLKKHAFSDSEEAPELKHLVYHIAVVAYRQIIRLAIRKVDRVGQSLLPSNEVLLILAFEYELSIRSLHFEHYFQIFLSELCFKTNLLKVQDAFDWHVFFVMLFRLVIKEHSIS